jgi:hypothetical protein
MREQMLTPIGRTSWVFPGGWIPLEGTGVEPTFTSNDAVRLFNAGSTLASVTVTIHYADREPVGSYQLTVAPCRVRTIRINDLIFPEAVPLASAYASVLESNVPIVVQVTRQDTRQAANALAGTIAFPDDPVELSAQNVSESDGERSVTMAEPIGRRRWAIADGYIPGWSHGPDPELTSHESACVLNTGDRDAKVEIMIFFTDREPVGPYRLTVPARRTSHIRFNDLSDPAPIPTATPFASLIEADVPVVVQQTRLDSRQAENALFSTVAFPGDT